MMFRAQWEEYGVEVRCKHGQTPVGDMSEVMEFLSAWQKEKQVQRAQQGAHDGLWDQALLKGLPVNWASHYGYQLIPEPVSMKLREEIIPEVFERSLALNQAERTHYQEEFERLKGEPAMIGQRHAAVEAQEQVR